MTLTYLKRLAVADVRDFGARGDGATDDTAAFQAAANSSRSVYVSAGTYRIVGQILLPAGASLVGDEATLICDPDGDYLGAVRVQSGCKVEGIEFQGNGSLTNTAAQGGNTQLGAAIRGYDCDNVLVTNCRFSDFVLPNTGGEAIVGFNKVSKVTVSENFFDVSNVGGIEINMSYRCWGSIVSKNQSYSNSDIFCTISTVGSQDVISGTEISVTSHHLITDNIHIKNAGAVNPSGRHGIYVHYNGGISHAIIKGNVIVNTRRHGIYLRGTNTIGGNTGPSIVSENIVRYCGGFAGAPNESPGYQSGIKVESTDGLICSQNIIEKCGYETDGTPRNGECAGIEITRAIRNAIISNNIVKDINGVGIRLYPSVAATVGVTNLENLDVSHNQVRGCTHASIMVGTHAGGSLVVPAKNVRVCYNIADVSRQDHAAIYVDTMSNSGNCPDTQIIGNIVYGIGSATGRAGIVVNGVDGAAYTITHNIFNDLNRGLYFAQRSSALGGVSISYTSHRAVGRDIWVDYNTFRNCTGSVVVSFLQQNRLCLIGENNQFISSGMPDRTVNGWNREVLGRRGGYDSAGNRLMEFYSTELPIDQQYYRGDRIINPDPTAGGVAEWICVTSGTPGTWQQKVVEAIP